MPPVGPPGYAYPRSNLNPNSLPIYPKVPTPGEYSLEQWKDLAAKHKSGIEGSDSIIKLNKDTHPLFKGKLETGFIFSTPQSLYETLEREGVRPDRLQEVYDIKVQKHLLRPDILTNDLFAKHQAGIILTPDSKHVGVFRASPNGTVSVWDPHGMPIVDSLSEFNTAKDTLYADNFRLQNYEPFPMQSSRGTCMPHSYRRLANTHLEDKEYRNKFDNALRQTALAHSDIPFKTRHDLLVLQQAEELLNTGFQDPDMEKTEGQRKELRENIVGGKDRRGFRR
jgi:hypothetical protein